MQHDNWHYCVIRTLFGDTRLCQSVQACDCCRITSEFCPCYILWHESTLLMDVSGFLSSLSVNLCLAQSSTRSSLQLLKHRLPHNTTIEFSFQNLWMKLSHSSGLQCSKSSSTGLFCFFFWKEGAKKIPRACRKDFNFYSQALIYVIFEEVLLSGLMRSTVLLNDLVGRWSTYWDKV